MKKTKKKIDSQKGTCHKMTAFGSDVDIIKLIEEDHKPLKKILHILKDTDKSLSHRQQALVEFAPLFLNHSRAEERSLYKEMEKIEELRTDSYEGAVEHQIAEEVLEGGLNEENDHMWSAKMKVLAELIEHHLKEEEEEMLPHFKKHSSAEERAVIGEKYLQLKSEFENADRNAALDETTDEEQPRVHMSH